ncbi:hypothetical protein PM082_010332 [Marasmius tenuissimus]|nr:hypothetical protein PM082_010332 [Marasmius tenuissimus]
MIVDDATENSSTSESLKTRPAAKRLSDDVLGDFSSRKKFKTDDALPPPSSNPVDSNFDYGDEFDSFFNTGVDHETLCPFCDSRLPKDPTPHLQKLIDDAVRKSKPQPRPTNRLGRKLAMGDYIHICQRHHFEAELLPQAEAKGWPKTIDFSKLEARVFKLKPRLKDILEDVEWKDQLGEDSDTWEVDAESPRALCVFWQETLKEVKSKGSKVAANVKSQFLTFHKTQPGYYGELGSVIIHHALYEMFPPSSVEPGLVAPLDPKEFIQRILVPEVAVRLIMEDRKTREPQVLTKLFRSCETAPLMV